MMTAETSKVQSLSEMETQLRKIGQKISQKDIVKEIQAVRKINSLR